MNQPVTIKLGNLQVEVAALPFGRLKKIVAAVNRVVLALQVGAPDESTLDDMLQVLAETIGKPVAELELLDTDLNEINAAFEAALRVSGLDEMLRKASQRLGEGKPGQSPALTPSMPSTPSSAPTSDGPGSTSTNA